MGKAYYSDQLINDDHPSSLETCQFKRMSNRDQMQSTAQPQGYDSEHSSERVAWEISPLHRTVFPGSFPKWCKDGGMKAVQALAGVMCPGATMHYWHSRKIVHERQRVSQRKHSQNLLSETNDNNLGAMLEGVPCLVDLSLTFSDLFVKILACNLCFNLNRCFNRFPHVAVGV